VVRVGFGTDSHSFEKSRKKPLVLGGITLGDSGGLEANSDGDVILHALFNALSQACGGHSLGYYADPLCERGITDSREYLKVARGMVEGIGFRVCNVGIMVEAQKPHVTIEQSAAMKRSIAESLRIAETDVGITFTSGERLSSFGKGEGVLAQAIVSITETR
jgi:2-C-methyl-D-erythritol 2,4-cyclodiphosphate synthase